MTIECAPREGGLGDGALGHPPLNSDVVNVLPLGAHSARLPLLMSAYEQASNVRSINSDVVNVQPLGAHSARLPLLMMTAY